MILNIGKLLYCDQYGTDAVSDKHALTTGEVARYCGVNFRTVIRWIERGHLEAYKLPGRGDNRIPRTTFLRFLEQNHMPVPDELQPHKAELLLFLEPGSVQSDVAACCRYAGWDPRVVTDELQLGFYLGEHAPAGLIVEAGVMPSRIDRLLSSGNHKEVSVLRIALCHPDKVEKMCAGWHIVNWPSEQQALLALLSRTRSDNVAGYGET